MKRIPNHSIKTLTPTSANRAKAFNKKTVDNFVFACKVLHWIHLQKRIKSGDFTFLFFLGVFLNSQIYDV